MGAAMNTNYTGSHLQESMITLIVGNRGRVVAYIPTNYTTISKLSPTFNRHICNYLLDTSNNYPKTYCNAK